MFEKKKTYFEFSENPVWYTPKKTLTTVKPFECMHFLNISTFELDRQFIGFFC